MRLLTLGTVVALSACSSQTCSPESCPDGCCKSGICQTGNASIACGINGLDCTDCTAGLLPQVCGPARECGSCGPDNCAGCCSDDQCKPKVAADMSCGEGGVACIDCTATGQACNGTSFTCEGGPEPLGADGGVVALNVAVGNLYADSIFTLAIQVDTPDGGGVPVDGAVPFGTALQVLAGQTIAFQATDKFPALAQIDPRARLNITASVESVGQTTNYTASTTLSGATLTKDTLGFAYDFDSATAKFELHYGWAHFP